MMATPHARVGQRSSGIESESNQNHWFLGLCASLSYHAASTTNRSPKVK